MIYDVARLVEASGLPERRVFLLVRASGTTWKLRRETGLDLARAEEWADRVGLPAVAVWPEIVDHVIEEADRRKREGWNRRRRRYFARHPEAAEANRVRRRRYYEENGDYERARQRRYYEANAERERERSRRNRARRKAAA